MAGTETAAHNTAKCARFHLQDKTRFVVCPFNTKFIAGGPRAVLTAANERPNAKMHFDRTRDATRRRTQRNAIVTRLAAENLFFTQLVFRQSLNRR